MYLNTFLIATAATLATVNAKPAQRRQFGNETVTDLPTFTSSDGLNLETMPTLAPSNSTIGSSIATSETQSVITSIESTTLTYTLGPEGSSSVVTTVIEKTSTMTLTRTIYVTLTESDDITATSEPAATETGSEPIITSDPSITETESEPTATFEPTLTETGDEPTATETGVGPIDTGFPTATETGFNQTDTAVPTAIGTGFDPTDIAEPTATETGFDPIDTAEPTASDIGDGQFGSSEPTVTVTDYLTTTMTITMEPVPTDTSGGDFELDPGAFFQTDGFDFDFGADTNPGGNGHHGHHGHHSGCGKTTVTSTIVEHSTVTVTEGPTSTDNLPLDPTATPSYGFGNGTDTTATFPTASSGFLTFYRRSRPTKV